MGDGPFRSEFENRAIEARIDALFTGRLPYELMVGKMCSCDIVVNPIVKMSAASVINKVGDYALSALPVINTQESPEYRTLIEQYNCGINCECGNSEEVADAIEKLTLDENLRKKMGYNSLRLGREKFDRRYTYKHIVNAVEELISK